jgi:sugar-specific transcriptional regulator TrmB
MIMDTDALKKFGLNENEIKVYLALLREGETTASKLALKAGLHRRTSYDTLDSLMEKGLAKFSIKERKKYFEAIPPKALLDITKEKEDAIKSIIPHLEEIYNPSTESTKAQIFSGIKSIKKIFDDVLNYKSYCSLGAGESLRTALGPYFLLFQKQKEELGIISRILMAGKLRKKDVATKTIGEVRFSDDYEAPTTTMIYGNKVAIIMTDTPMAIVIDSDKIAKSFQNYFEMLWSAAKE